MSKQREAFCLMKYRCDDCGHQEVIWNSRDGITPFSTMCPSCTSNMNHVDFKLDSYDPNHKLNRFQKYWRDGTEKEAEVIAKARAKLIKKARKLSNEEYYRTIRVILSDFDKGWPKLDVYMGDK